MDLTDFLKTQRQKKGLSQRELSKLSGISNSEISRIESGERKTPSHKILYSLAKALEIPYGEFLEKAGYFPDEGDSIAQNYGLPPDLVSFVKEESKRGWVYTRLAQGLSLKKLSRAELSALLDALITPRRKE